MFINTNLLTILLVVSPIVLAQQPGTMTPEKHLPLPFERCEKGGKCTPVHGEIVMDAAWRWVHDAQGHSCQNGDKWDATICPDNVTCAKNCMLEGISDYGTTYGVSTSGNTLRLNYVTKNANGKSVGSRLYLMANENHYEMFKLLGQEFTFDVDVSTLPCGTNAALYLISMEADGGTSKHPTNKAGAKYGVGYCDSQCPRGARFIQGQANSDGTKGECCAEMDIWEANMEAAAFTSHPCDPAYHICSGDACGLKDRYATVCDPDGCGYNPYAMGDHSFYGPGKTVDTKKVFTVVTQFIESGGSLSEIRRIYVQGGKVISKSNTMTTATCANARHGGLKKMGEAIQAGMVLSAALWDDAGGHMAWLDSGNNGPCPSSAGDPAEIEAKYANSYVTYSNIRVGPINSTFHA